MGDSIEKVKCLIIGSGPAGYTAAIYASRADLKPVLYTGMEPGGQLTTTTEVDNFPGYPEGIDGPTMMVQLQQQAERFGTDVRIGMVTSVTLSDQVGGVHKATVDGTKEITADKKIRKATHPAMQAWKIGEEQGIDNCGESGAGQHLMKLLEETS